METLFITTAVLYFILHLILLKGLMKSFNLTANTEEYAPAVTVIVAGKNEALNIPGCIESLSELNYPHNLLEIILVNDNSEDNTYEIMADAADKYPFMKVISSRGENLSNLKGIANAIDTAADICKGEIIFLTDADCRVNPGWIKNTLKYYSEDSAMICGYTLMDTDNSVFARLQCIDWIYLLTIASSSSGLYKIISCIGNNLSFSKDSYIRTGGYKSINFSVTEDLALMRKIDSEKNLSIRFPVDKECIVITNPCKNISEVFSQKRRWFRGGTDVNLLGYFTGLELYAMNFLFVCGLLFLNVKLYLLLTGIKFLSELILLNSVFKRFERKSLLKFYPLFSVYFAVVGLLLPLSFVTGKKIKWKGRDF